MIDFIEDPEPWVHHFCTPVLRMQLRAERGSVMDDEARVAVIRERAEFATKGPWGSFVGYILDDDTPQTRLADVFDDADAEFIAHARSDIPWLLDRLRAAEAERDTDRATWLQQVTALGESVIAAEARAAEAEAVIAKLQRHDDPYCLTHCGPMHHSQCGCRCKREVRA